MYLRFIETLSFFSLTFSLFGFCLDFEGEINTILKHQRELFNVLLPQTGFTKFEDLKDFLKQSYPLRMQQFDTELVLAIFAPSSVRAEIFQHGLKNLFETKLPERLPTLKDRFNIERSLLNYSDQNYQDIDISLRPKYGIVATMSQMPSIIYRMAPYGDDIYILKRNTRKRITWTPGDSYNRTHEKTADFVLDCASWDEIFIPWCYRHIVIPYLSSDDKSCITLPNIRENNPKCGLNPILGSAAIGDYMEFQIWGHVSLEDVRLFIHTYKEPSKKETKSLKRAGVKLLSIGQFQKRITS